MDSFLNVAYAMIMWNSMTWHISTKRKSFFSLGRYIYNNIIIIIIIIVNSPLSVCDFFVKKILTFYTWLNWPIKQIYTWKKLRICVEWRGKCGRKHMMKFNF